jgi:HEPN domain-containing protein
MFELCATLISIPFDDEIIIALDSLYIESRYPGEFGLLPNGKPNKDQAKTFYEFAESILEIVRTHLESRQ